MDLAYDHIQELALPKDSEQAQEPKPEQSSLNKDLQDAYRAISSSTWGARIGGFFGTVVKQGESVYREAQQELSVIGGEASRGLSGLQASIISRTRGLSLTSGAGAGATGSSSTAEKSGDPESAHGESSTADEQSETVLERIRREGAKRLQELQRAEEAADEALLKFGSNIRDFLQNAITIAPPSESPDNQGSMVLFESKDAQGKRVIHTSRFDAQLHVIHTNTESFLKDPSGTSDEFESWVKGFDIDAKTADISADLAKYPELRTTMEKLVPDQVSYAEFWKRYYFLRHGIETAEARRRDLLKAASAEEEVGWDEDSDDESPPPAPKTASKVDGPGSVESSTTIHPPKDKLLKPSESRKSDEKSQPDSEASYDVVGLASGVPSQAPNSPKDIRKGDDSDEEDWE